MQPERPIEKLLRAFARKRRDEAGGQFDLHPATQRMLQGEIARQYARLGGEHAPWWRSWARFWPRLAFATATLAAFVVGAFLLFPPVKRTQPTLTYAKPEAAAPPSSAAPQPPPIVARDAKAQAQVADKQLAATPPPAVAAPEPSSIVQPKTAQKQTFARLDSAVAGSISKPADEALNSLAAPAAPPPASNRTLTLAEVAVAEKQPASAAMGLKDVPVARYESVARDLRPKAALAQGQPDGLPGAGVSPGAMPLAKTSKLAESKKTTVARRRVTSALAASEDVQVQYFVRGTEAWARGLQNSNEAQAVLASFQLEQRGREIRIVDADGSIYTGRVQPAPAPALSVKATAAAPAPVRSSKAKEPALDDGKRAGGSSAGGAAPAPALNFTVRGTNATLRQAVVFVGNLQPDALAQQSAVSRKAQNVIVRFQNQTPAQNQFSSSRLTGRAHLANGAELEINAVPLPADANK
jgi:hypothetical protein